MNGLAKRAYRSQARKAKQRGIEFELTLDEWLDWWEQQLGKDWFEKRGCRKGQYVMARPGDEGPYALGNIECVLAEENHKSYNYARKPSKGWRHSHLPKEVVLAVYEDEAPYAEIVKKYEKHGMTKHKIQCIKQGHYYRKFTGSRSI
jgi:hypothetical protein